MSYGRQDAPGKVPEEVYVVSFGTSHRIYSALSSARSLYTQYKGDKNENIKIFRAVITDWEELDYKSPPKGKTRQERYQEQRERQEYERLRRKFND